MALGPNPFAPSAAAAPVTFQTCTPSDSVLLGGFQFLRIGAAGNVALKGVNDSVSTVIPVAAGEYVPFGAGYVMATGTTATTLTLIG